MGGFEIMQDLPISMQSKVPVMSGKYLISWTLRMKWIQVYL